jgi:hypothetical protein
MTRTLRLLVFAMLLVPAPWLVADEPARSFRLSGDVEDAGDWTAERLAELPGGPREIDFTIKGEPAKARCVPLLAVIEATKPRIDREIRGHRLAFVAIVRGRDGYTATFSLGELLPEYGRRDVWIALDHNGGPLGAKHAPFEVIVPADEKASRFVRAVEHITIVDTTRLGK